MALTFTLTDGTMNLPLVYNAANDYKFKLMYGASVSPSEPRTIWHTPDDAPPELVDLIDNNRVAYFTANILNDDGVLLDDDTINALIVLKRWVDGARQQAARFWSTGDVDRIDLKIQRDDSTNATLHPVIYGFVDDGSSHYVDAAELNNQAWGVVVMLTLAPYGEGENIIDLHNDIENPALLFESAVGGLAANWSENAAPVTTLDNDIYLNGGQSQKTVADSGAGIESDLQSDTETSGCAYVWAYVTAGDVLVAFSDDDAAVDRDSGVLDSTDSNNVSDKTATDINGNTWYRVPMSSNVLVSGNNHHIRMVASGGAATWYADNAYMDIGSATVPDAWCSGSVIYNRNDQTPANPERINYFDLWGIPGDAPPLVTYKNDTTAATQRYVFASRTADGIYLANDKTHWIESDAFSAQASSAGAWSQEAGAARSNGTFERLTEGGAPGVNTIRWNFTGATARQMFSHPSNMFVIVHASNAPVTTFTTTELTTSTTIGVTTLPAEDDTWLFVNLGLLNLQNVMPQAVPDASEPSLTIQFSIVTAALATVNIDAIMLMPNDYEYLVVGNLEDIKTNGEFWVVGGEERVINEDTGLDEKGVLGSLWTLEPGNVVNRTLWVLAKSTLEHTLTNAFDINAEVLPRTRHLLGTV